ncbi:MAG TPA: hypothetical protein VFV84_09095 [Burkholderiales bacterium]|nr:hypothetical protein [Burkholderiales bacterium]
MKRLLFSLAVLSVGAGCALLQPEAAPARQVREIVGEAVAAARAAPEDQRQRLGSARQAYEAAPDDASGVRYAALLATLPAPLRDESRAAEVLAPIAVRQPATPVTELAALLSAGVAERQRLAREARGAEQRAQAASQRAEAAAARAEAAERREESANERASKLQGQVEALKSIERSILQREERRRNVKR